ncbi:bifunctional phosphopantothenoylcysteine decarboxylase/phosphopantothenate--cysteine ligase CoaBC [Sulfuritalea hydrogenivorans]|jgi:phosphopantothenoylcysteine decarboxylase/phosphopantothenate--cysteine ligase|uniref:Coenzyme A biosynthesis bifunctional protein CoaBC n=1 Tax=Sulfuritalea hydrogenivorans sk43H TaxID=1223802 RepID=W0SCX2_9PROT|nr:bifunctional phosphopantothenoylcysteine decarboxylase/phosphopantothenate--cysteine ligase CoaBC [Sulfuritalea hydrogenivorans]MDK9714531.1 bifunctional phosphopantothenoylcysteine decarboxylase/phosphopantothenate--cysteine ligase CoaBC [Sulfuritalea sp.]BAO28876.1 bifunctional phosphopantothenoylcysteine decarboxylase/phosphopantothenate synthase [Sulfuritalea hydrogenivorans sk43H]
MNEFQGKRIVLGVTGGVAAYKAAELVRLLVKAGAEVDVALTAAGAQFVGAASFQALTGRRVWQALWDERMDNGMAHIDLTRGAAALLVAPATADFLAKLAHGFADDLLSTLCLARDCPLLVAPAMNRQMWENPATQRNVGQLRVDGVSVLGPAHGEQACGEVGDGRMLEAGELFDDLHAFLLPKVLAGKRVLLTAGPTFEALDPVRGLTNSSSGKMGFALARACAAAGAQVTLVAGPVSLATPRGVRRMDVQSAAQMREAVLQALPGQDIFIGVAAVADYRPRQTAAHKIKKGTSSLTLELDANPDIIAEVAARSDAPFCVGFAAESRDLATYAEGKRVGKKLGLVVGNLIQDGLGGDTNAVTLFDATGAHVLPPADKSEVARGIVAHIAALMETPHGQH